MWSPILNLSKLLLKQTKLVKWVRIRVGLMIFFVVIFTVMDFWFPRWHSWGCSTRRRPRVRYKKPSQCFPRRSACLWKAPANVEYYLRKKPILNRLILKWKFFFRHFFLSTVPSKILYVPPAITISTATNLAAVKTFWTLVAKFTL